MAIYTKTESKISGLKKTLFMTVAIAMGFVLSGCVVGNDEYEEIQRQCDDYRRELLAMHQENDMLNQEISGVYKSWDMLATQLALIAAVDIHKQYTADLSAPKPAQTTRQTPGQTTTSTARPPRQTSGAAATSGDRSPSATSGTTRPSPPASTTPTNTGTRTPAGGQTTTTGGGGSSSGSVDWGF